MTARETEDGALRIAVLQPCPFCGSVDVKPRNDDVAYLPPATRYVLKRGTFYFCRLCCHAMATAGSDYGEAYEERSIQWRTLKARMEAGI